MTGWVDQSATSVQAESHLADLDIGSHPLGRRSGVPHSEAPSLRPVTPVSKTDIMAAFTVGMSGAHAPRSPVRTETRIRPARRREGTTVEIRPNPVVTSSIDIQTDDARLTRARSRPRSRRLQDPLLQVPRRIQAAPRRQARPARRRPRQARARRPRPGQHQRPRRGRIGRRHGRRPPAQGRGDVGDRVPAQGGRPGGDREDGRLPLQGRRARQGHRQEGLRHGESAFLSQTDIRPGTQCFWQPNRGDPSD